MCMYLACQVMDISLGDLEYVSGYNDFECVFKAANISGSHVSSGEDQKRRKEREYKEIVSYARDQLYDYYGSAGCVFPAARAELSRIKNMSPEEILQQESGLTPLERSGQRTGPQVLLAPFQLLSGSDSFAAHSL